jgi:hypothetical protein
MHREIGKCNSNELYNIIEKERPEIIFEEFDISRTDDEYYKNGHYKYQESCSVETTAIMKYLENYKVIHIPVDTYEVPDEIHEKKNFLYNRISENNPEYIKLLKEQCIMTFQNGFSFLNSDRINSIIEDIHNIEKNTLRLLNNNALFSIHNKWTEITNNRENEMLNNIYKYSNENKYNNAVLITGAEHGKSILSKAKEYNIKENLEINWKSWHIV